MLVPLLNIHVDLSDKKGARIRPVMNDACRANHYSWCRRAVSVSQIVRMIPISTRPANDARQLFPVGRKAAAAVA